MAKRSDPVRRTIVQQLESLERAGVSSLPRRRSAKASAKTPVAASPGAEPPAAVELVSATPVAKQPPVAEPPKSAVVSAQATSAVRSSSTPSNGAAEALRILRDEVAGCTRCSLSETRTQTVFGVGNPQARLCFLGEAPGADEDKQGEPFVGRAGQLQNQIIEACKLKRSDVYILNVLKCRPPENRTPQPDEVATCRGFFERQLEAIRPEFICCLGAVAAQSLLQTDVPIGRLRGKFHDYHGIRVVCTYHPAYLLRNPPAKRHVWDDMKMLMREMGVEL